MDGEEHENGKVIPLKPIGQDEAQEQRASQELDAQSVQQRFIPDVGIRMDPKQNYVRPSCQFCGNELSRYCYTGQLGPGQVILIAPMVCPVCHVHSVTSSPVVMPGQHLPGPRRGVNS